MRIIFLDIDGVLNSMAYFKSNKKTTESLFNDISDFHLKKLSEIYHTCDAHIVLSSTWRGLDDEYNMTCRQMWEYLVGSLEKYGMKIMSKTPVIDQNRPLEIKTWLDNRVDKDEIRFVSLDDDFSKESYDKYGIGDCLVKTKFFCDKLEDGGLQDIHVKQAVKILMGDEL